MSTRLKPGFVVSLCVALCLGLLGSVVGVVQQPSTASAANPGHSLIGAIRWDGQVGSLGSWGVGLEEERAMGPSAWHFRLPFYGTEPTANSATMRATTQAIIDQEIAYAKDAGIDYWAFCWYPSGTGLETAKDLYLSSAYKNDVNWAAILFTNPLMSTSDLNTLVNQFKQSNYQKVLNGRPLVYAYNNASFSAAQITDLRNKSTAAGVPNPYIVALDYSASSASTFANNIGADAISSYVTPGSNGQSYSTAAYTERTNWDAYKATGKKVIPWVTHGWDPRPRIELNPAYGFASYSSNQWMQRATPSELQNQLQSAINWNASNTSAAEANAVLVYAWNEFSEGGYLAPLKSGSSIDKDYLDAVKSVTKTISATSGDPAKTSFVTATALTTLRNNYSDYVGMKITVGSSAITVSELGRYYVAGNSRNHVLKIVNAKTNTTVASTIINMGAGTADALGFKYAALGSSVTLSANTPYYIVSSESNGGDQWYEGNSTVIPTGAAVINNAVYRTFDYTSGHPTGEDVYHLASNPGNSYGLVNFKYSGGSSCTSGANLAMCRTYSASSQWDATQAAGKAFDGVADTNWQAASGFSGQWVEVNFGASTTFNKVVLSEYGSRTSGFRIEYWNGSAWVTAYTGTTIGSKSAPSVHLFTAPVTGTKARIYYTGGTYTPILHEFEIYNQDTGLKGEWKLNDNASDSAGTNNGTLTSGPVYTAGKNGNGISLDGVDDYVNVPDSAALDGMSALTLSAWVNLAKLPPAGQVYIPVGKDSSDASYRLYIGSDGKPGIAVATTANAWYSSSATYTTSTTAVTPGQWAHIVGTYDGSKVRVYVDGVKTENAGTISGSIVNSASPLRFGYNPYDPSTDYTNGKMDEVRIYSRALNDTEVLNLKNSY